MTLQARGGNLLNLACGALGLVLFTSNALGQLSPAENHTGASCGYFTRPHVESRCNVTTLNYHSNRAVVCHGRFEYRCESGRWTLLSEQCQQDDRRQARIMERSEYELSSVFPETCGDSDGTGLDPDGQDGQGARQDWEDEDESGTFPPPPRPSASPRPNPRPGATPSPFSGGSPYQGGGSPYHGTGPYGSTASHSAGRDSASGLQAPQTLEEACPHLESRLLAAAARASSSHNSICGALRSTARNRSFLSVVDTLPISAGGSCRLAGSAPRCRHRHP